MNQGQTENSTTPQPDQKPIVQKSPMKEPETKYPEKIAEAQGDLADRANIEIDQELQEQIAHARGAIHGKTVNTKLPIEDL